MSTQRAQYKYAVRRLRRKQDQLSSRKMAEAFVGDNSRDRRSHTAELANKRLLLMMMGYTVMQVLQTYGFPNLRVC